MQVVSMDYRQTDVSNKQKNIELNAFPLGRADVYIYCVYDSNHGACTFPCSSVIIFRLPCPTHAASCAMFPFSSGLSEEEGY